MKKTLTKTFSINNRSSKRTDCIHERIAQLVDEKYPNLETMTEHQLEGDGFHKSFKVDIVSCDEEKLHTAYLVKMVNSNYAQNANNYANTTVGEVARLMAADFIPPHRIVFLNLYPVEAPYFRKDGQLKSWQKVKPVDFTKIKEKIFDNIEGCNVCIHNYFFSYNKEDITHKKDLKDIKNIDIPDEENQNDKLRQVL